MNNIKLLPLSLLLLLTLSCNKMLMESPKSIVASNFYNTPAEAQAAVAAIFSPIRSNSCFGAVYEAIQEAQSDWFEGRASYAPISGFNGLDGTNTTRVSLIWNDFYQSILYANLVIKNLSGKNELGNQNPAIYIGEAKFMRALCFFYLVRNWGGVPLRTDQNMDSTSLPRSSVADVYNLITSDLTYAEGVLPDSALPGLPTIGAAKTVLADVYFYQGLYAQASEKAGEVIQSGNYALVPVSQPSDFENLFGAAVTTSSEEIFYLHYDQQSSWAYPLYTAGVGTPYLGVNGYYAIYGSSLNPIYENWSDSDLRKQYGWYQWNTSLGPNVILNKKFNDPGAQLPTNSYPMYRYADLLLLYAEATCEADGHPTPDAMEALNEVHRRAYGYNPNQPSPVDFKLSDYDEQSFIKLVIRERGYETQAEGKRWLDLKRSGMATEYIQEAWGKTPTQRALLWPIPVSELNYNKALNPSKDQNPGY